MRAIVQGLRQVGDGGSEQITLWFRFDTSGDPARVDFYRRVQQNAVPSAPQSDAQEVADFQAGMFIERPSFDVIDPASGEPDPGRIKNLYTAYQAFVEAQDSRALSSYGASLAADGTVIAPNTKG